MTVDVSVLSFFFGHFRGEFHTTSGDSLFTFNFFIFQLNFVSRNSNYLSDVLLPVAMKKYDEISGGRSDLLSELSMQLRGPPKPKPRSVYKTDVI